MSWNCPRFSIFIIFPDTRSKHRRAVDTVGFKICPLRHGTGNDRCRCCAKYRLKNSITLCRKRADTEIHHIFHQDISCIFCPGQPSLTKSNPGLHKKYQDRCYKYPDYICLFSRNKLQPPVYILNSCGWSLKQKIYAGYPVPIYKIVLQ